jgi:hypothetical protein
VFSGVRCSGPSSYAEDRPHGLMGLLPTSGCCTPQNIHWGDSMNDPLPTVRATYSAIVSEPSAPSAMRSSDSCKMA